MKICLNCVRNSINSHSPFPVVVILWYSVLRKYPPCVDIFWIDSEWMFRLLHCMLKLGSGLQQHVRLVPTNNLCWCRWWWWGWCWCWWCSSKDIVFNSMFVWFLQNGDDHQADSDNYNHLFLSNSDESSDLQLVVSLSRSARWWSATLWLARVTRSLVTIKMVIMLIVMMMVLVIMVIMKLVMMVMILVTLWQARVTWSLLTETVMVNIKKMVMLVKVMVMMKTYLQSASELLRELSLIGVVRHQHWNRNMSVVIVWWSWSYDGNDNNIHQYLSIISDAHKNHQ